MKEIRLEIGSGKERVVVLVRKPEEMTIEKALENALSCLKCDLFMLPLSLNGDMNAR